jgi:hypothetical protein
VSLRVNNSPITADNAQSFIAILSSGTDTRGWRYLAAGETKADTLEYPGLGFTSNVNTRGWATNDDLQREEIEVAVSRVYGAVSVSPGAGSSPLVKLNSLTGQLDATLVAAVTAISIASANGFAGSVSNPTTTPELTLSTSITGLLKGNGTAISAAVSGTDYQAAGNYITALSGDATATGPGSAAVSAVKASVLKSATTEIDIVSATAPVNGQVLTATSGTAATWQTLNAITALTGDVTATGPGSAAASAVKASVLKSATTDVNVSAATAPVSGQILTATSSTTATWQTSIYATKFTAGTAISSTPTTLAASDAYKYREVTTVGAQLINISGTAGHAAGDRIQIYHNGTSTLTFAGTNGMTVEKPAGAALTAFDRYSWIEIVFLSATRCSLVGRLTPA